jgi:hypothetical protein
MNWTVLRNKSILKWCALGKTRPILQWQNSWFTGCDGNLLILNGKITPGVQLPIRKEVYQPILKELEEYGVVFKEQSMTYYGYARQHK